MGLDKKRTRQRFRDATFKRDGYACVMCPFSSTPASAEKELDAHHISDRREMPNGGYVPENGITLCAPCHVKAEEYHSTGTAHPGYSPSDLYQKIGSSYHDAVTASNRLK